MISFPGLSEKETAAAWEAMTPAHREAVLWRAEWLPKRKSYQIEPEGDWTYWLIQAGRGAGKTRTGAEWTGWGAVTDPGSRSLVAAPTAADLRDTCFEGESGLLAVIPRSLVSNYARSLNEIILTNGSIIKGIPASEPERFRGPQ
jgi:phage terminase large subunit-like protein